MDAMEMLAAVVVCMSMVLLCAALAHRQRRILEQQEQELARRVAARLAMQAGSEEHQKGLPKQARDALPVLVITNDNASTLLPTSDDKSCAVCLSEYTRGERVVALPCSHAFHHSCLDGWLDKHCTCPLCRASLLPDPSQAAAEMAKLDADAASTSAPTDNHNGASATDPALAATLPPAVPSGTAATATAATAATAASATAASSCAAHGEPSDGSVRAGEETWVEVALADADDDAGLRATQPAHGALPSTTLSGPSRESPRTLDVRAGTGAVTTASHQTLGTAGVGFPSNVPTTVPQERREGAAEGAREAVVLDIAAAACTGADAEAGAGAAGLAFATATSESRALPALASVRPPHISVAIRS